MNEMYKKYVIISASILLVLFELALCWLVGFNIISIVFAYVLGIANGMLILGVLNNE